MPEVFGWADLPHRKGNGSAGFSGGGGRDLKRQIAPDYKITDWAAASLFYSPAFLPHLTAGKFAALDTASVATELLASSRPRRRGTALLQANHPVKDLQEL